jgi:hypothetical protein
MTRNHAVDKQNVVAKRRVACAQFRINVCAIDMKMNSLNPQAANNSPLGGSTDVQFRQINHQKKDFALCRNGDLQTAGCATKTNMMKVRRLVELV